MIFCSVFGYYILHIFVLEMALIYCLEFPKLFVFLSLVYVINVGKCVDSTSLNIFSCMVSSIVLFLQKFQMCLHSFVCSCAIAPGCSVLSIFTIFYSFILLYIYFKLLIFKFTNSSTHFSFLKSLAEVIICLCYYSFYF